MAEDRGATQQDIDRLIDRINSLEQKLWGLVAAVFVLVVGYIFQQLQTPAAPPAAITGVNWILIRLLDVIR